MRHERLFTAGLSLVEALLAGVIGVYLWSLTAVNAPGPLAKSVTVIIRSGTGLATISKQLTDTAVVSNGLLFQFEARRSGKDRALKPGEYRFEAGSSITAVIDKIVKREVVARFVTIPEGLVTADILRILAGTEGLLGDSPDNIVDGELMPETYRYEWGDTKTSLIERMRKATQSVLAELWALRTPNLPFASPQEAMTLASIVEKETGIAAERPKVAAVFINRLNKKMRLQSDPTVIYGVNPQGLDRELTREELNTPTAFNTYIIDRLPPSPICHPGRAAIAAVLSPEATDAVYFVADGSGGHAFAATLAEHNRNVARWRKLALAKPEPTSQPVARAKPASVAKPTKKK